MTDEMKRLIRATTDEGPRPGFVLELRSALVDELETLDTNKTPVDEAADIVAEPELSMAHDDIVIFEVDVDPPEDSSRRSVVTWLPVAAALIGIAVVAWLLVGLNRDDSGIETVDIPEDEPITSELGLGAVRLPTWVERAAVLEPGTYETNTIGTTLTFSSDEQTTLGQYGNGLLAFSETDGRRDRTLVIRRLASLPPPAAPTADLVAADWPASDVRGWVDELDETILVEADFDAQVGGLPATRLVLQIGQFGCGQPEGCPVLPIAQLESTSSLLEDGARYEMWLISPGEEDPIAVVKSIASEQDGDQTWFRDVDDLIETFEFGSIGQNPWRVVEAGPVELSAFGGVSLELPDDRTQIIEPNDALAQIIAPSLSGRLSLLTNPVTFEGQAITTVDQMIAVFEDKLFELEPRSTLSVDGRDVRSFEVVTGTFAAPTFALGRGGPVATGWDPQGVWWLIEDSDLGLLIIESNANRFSGDAELVDEIVRTFDFAEDE